MKKLVFLLLIASLVITFSACTLHFPYDWEWDVSEYRVILKVEPDDAQVLLNGKWIGDAYEFSTWESAIRLSSRNNELIIKKEGYVEELIDLYEYKSRKIVLRIQLMKDKDYSPSAASKPLPEKMKPAQAEKQPEYKAKTLPPKEVPPTIQEKELSTEPIQVTITIQPDETSIYLDGKFWGISPPSGKIKNLRLVPGKYTIEAIKPGYKDYKNVIEVKDKKLNINIKLEKK